MSTAAIGILGVGRLGEALAHAMLALPGQEALFVTKRSVERVARLCEADARVRPCEPEALLKSSDYVVVALGPDSARELLGTLPFESRHHVVSVMAEISLAELRQLTGAAGSACRALALPSAARGGQPLPVYPATPAVEYLFGRRNDLIVAGSEQELLTYWSITGLLSTVLTAGAVAAQWLERAGIEKESAEAYSRVLFSEVHGLTADGFDEGLQHVSTPGGLNVMMLEHLAQVGLAPQLSEGLDQISRRLLKSLAGSSGPKTF
jgi:pyrroline-5-carboxylate reductase